MADTDTKERVLYTAAARVIGGRTHGHGRTTDGALEVDLRIPTELGGEGGGTNPEQLFAVGHASCFESALGAVARRRKMDPEDVEDVEIDAKVMLIPTKDRAFQLAVELDVTLPSITDRDVAVDLVLAAEQVCPYSNATRGNIDRRLTANGAPVDA
jgi:lipoyl-dependent peroxiredoxin